MRTFFKIMAVFMLLFGFSSCDDDEEMQIAVLEVNYANLAGTWQLTEWNGQATPGGTYCYITFDRKERSFVMYQKFDSMKARRITGQFTVKQDNYLGYLIHGKYDYGMGEWNNSYIVTDLLASGSMVWTVKDNPDDASKYERCEAVPQEIIDEARGGM